ncbi:membrane-bound lytic murein transglycosylase B [Acinetobacter marinus]|uniref:Membrane-bound lytic murein transglycosylase B n=2 Tax=Acinetobacter marinus TaxID=281375 RepID=A0A1G6M537_9GAMM|nr:membrane-bound lytic murein transglycosylase B [Acinetobacter marinus]
MTHFYKKAMTTLGTSALFSLGALLSTVSHANEFMGYPAYTTFKSKAMQQYGLSAQQVDNAMSGAQNIDRILSIMAKPGESKPWYEYRKNFLVESTIQRGVRFKNQYASALRRAEQTYGVPQSVILGILGVETGYGANKGSFITRDALATLAFGYPRRADYFQDELAALIAWTYQDGRVTSSVKGSYAGAIGYPQFMPSNITKLGVDFDGNGHIDLENSPVDAIGSIANFVAKHGWQTGQPVAIRAIYTGTDDTQVIAPDLRTAKPYLAGELGKMGVRPINPSMKLDPMDMVHVIRLDEVSGPQYWITYPNFISIIGYNPSRMYVSAVWQLGQEVANR